MTNKKRILFLEVFKDDWNGDANTLDVVDSSSLWRWGNSPKRTELITVKIELNKSESNI